MQATNFLVESLFGLYLMAVILRFWMQTVRADFYNPFSQFIVKVTNPPLIPLRRIIPGLWGLDLASIVLMVLIAAAKIFILFTLNGGGMVNPMELLIVTLVAIIKEGLNIVFWIIVIRALMSWVSQGHSPIDQVLYQLTEPLLRPVRKIIPPMGGFDLSVLVVLLGLQFVSLLLIDMFGRF
ncbi:hypothetical protein C2869_14015 [Saccharobesus litoralis]|uniref:YggT family protein n=1 Tax=Saccharobesus litoralis TaxID=2172099 RepID=A0A2S0VTF1_9ALTE|nr:YggT family protein [Saccharobesus litoralis]AWB67485.1 hypothetical protein C2869_14015 [Saccharobesus litoralis]